MLAMIQDRILQKKWLRGAGLSGRGVSRVDAEADLADAIGVWAGAALSRARTADTTDAAR